MVPSATWLRRRRSLVPLVVCTSLQLAAAAETPNDDSALLAGSLRELEVRRDRDGRDQADAHDDREDDEEHALAALAGLLGLAHRLDLGAAVPVYLLGLVGHERLRPFLICGVRRPVYDRRSRRRLYRGHL